MIQKAKYVAIVLDKAYRLESLTNEFFEIIRYNLQHVELEKESIDLHYMLIQMTDEFYLLLSNHENDIKLGVKEDIIIYGDSDKLARVDNNILKNAIAYSYPNISIHIWTKKSDNIIFICFQNKKNHSKIKIKCHF